MEEQPPYPLMTITMKGLWTAYLELKRESQNEFLTAGYKASVTELLEKEIQKMQPVNSQHLPISNPNTMRPSPTDSATLYAPGYTMQGNDGNMWEVKVTNSGIHRRIRARTSTFYYTNQSSSISATTVTNPDTGSVTWVDTSVDPNAPQNFKYKQNYLSVNID